MNRYGSLIININLSGYIDRSFEDQSSDRLQNLIRESLAFQKSFEYRIVDYVSQQ